LPDQLFYIFGWGKGSLVNSLYLFVLQPGDVVDGTDLNNKGLLIGENEAI